MALHKIREELKTKRENEIDRKLSDEFYAALRFKFEYRVLLINTRRQLVKYFDLCQILRDMVNIGEETEWNLRTSVQSIYRSIGAYVNRLDDSSGFDNNMVRRLLIDSSADLSESVASKIRNVYEVVRPNESFGFNRNNLDNVRLLFHGSRVNNFVGILSRGLILPKYVTHEAQNELQRTDEGKLEKKIN